jgi:hypothetical protein
MMPEKGQILTKEKLDDTGIVYKKVPKFVTILGSSMWHIRNLVYIDMVPLKLQSYKMSYTKSHAS